MTPRRLSLFLPLFLLTAGCDTGDVAPEPDCTGGVSGLITATIDGTPFEAECRTFSFAGGDLTVTGFAVTGAPGARLQRRITLVVPDFAAGPFAVGGGATALYEEIDLDTGSRRTFDGVSGEVVGQQDFPENPSGTFAFTARGGGETVAITGGVFDVYP